MTKSMLLFVLLLTNCIVFAQNDMINLLIETYEKYYDLNKPEGKNVDQEIKPLKPRIQSICPPKSDDFYQSFKTKFIDFRSLREGETVNTFSFNDSLCSPLIRSLELTSNYGMRDGKKHFGIDFRVNMGDSVRSIFCGKVRIAKWDNTYGYVVVIRHYNMSETVYAHLDKILVNIGQEIEVGHVIGLGGNTGKSSGSHLHFELRYKGFPINPIVEDKFLKTIPLKVF